MSGDLSKKWEQMTPEERQRAASNLDALFRSFDVSEALHAKTDAEIADLVIEHVWGEHDLTSAKSCLIGEAVERLRRSNGGPFEPPEEP